MAAWSGCKLKPPAHPGVILPPPLLYAGAFVLSLALNWAWPVPILSHPAIRWTGATVLLLGIALNLWGARSMMKARTPINPYRPVTTVVGSGAFRLSRNPLYVGLDLIFLGLTLILNNLWGALALLAVLVVMHYGVIRREERYLEARFGEPYRQYFATVRRYL